MKLARSIQITNANMRRIWLSFIFCYATALQFPISPHPSPFCNYLVYKQRNQKEPIKFQSSSPSRLLLSWISCSYFIKICRFCVFLRPIKGHLHLNLAFELWSKSLLKSSHVFSDFHHYYYRS